MSTAKSKLKLARDALDKKDYVKAKDASLAVLDHESSNYNAHVFLGLALLELGEVKDSEQAYQEATKLQPAQQLAWQKGLSKLYERAERWPEYVHTLRHLMDIHHSQNDAVRCAESLQKVIDMYRGNEDRFQLIEALILLLPNSRFYAVLSMLPPPDDSATLATTTSYIQRAIYQSLPFLQEIASLLEKYEEDLFDKELEKRRTRLGAPNLEQLRKMVGQDVWSSSRLSLVYSEIANHPGSSDNLRHETESKLLKYKYRHLCSVTGGGEFSETKERLLQEVNDLVKSFVLLQIPDGFAWNLALEQQDSETIATCDLQLIRNFVDLFPNRPTAILLKLFFTYIGLDLLGGSKMENATQLETYTAILDVYSDISGTILANRALAEVYAKDEDYENAMNAADNTLLLLEKTEGEIGIRLSRTKSGIKSIKATSLVHLSLPRYHSLASAIINEVLLQFPTNVPCLLARAFILQAEQKWREANTVYLHVADLLSDDSHGRSRAVEEAAWCQFHCGEQSDGLASLQRVLAVFSNVVGKESDRARCLWRIGQCYWEMNAENRQESYRFYIASLKRDPAYAPAFTSLGLYYTEIEPRDPDRASKCFQKAFELDPRQCEAARRLAESFASDHAWDLVDFVARRTIEGDSQGSLGNQSLDVSGLQSMNPWAWNAVGVVELTRGNYLESIKAFQAALKIDVNDGLLWSRLGEAYSKSKRFAAASKAFSKAQELVPDDWTCQYFIADVKGQTGDFHGAIAIYSRLLSGRPDDPVILVRLIQAYLGIGHLEHLEGFPERAEQSFLIVLQLALKAIQERGSRIIYMKPLADALFYLSALPWYHNQVQLREALAEVHNFDLDDDDDLTGVIPRTKAALVQPVGRGEVLIMALVAYRDQVKNCPRAVTRGSQWYDLAVGMQAWISQSRTKPDAITKKCISRLQRALQEDVHNDSYWVALGRACFSNRTQLAQHAYIRALEIDTKNVVNWANLGLFYLHYRDFELANEAFIRAQTLDPDNSTSWIGQAFLRSMTGFESEAQDLLAHAINLNPVKMEADLEFAHMAFQQHLISSGHMSCHLISAFFVLHRYCARRSGDPFALHLFGLLKESLGLLESAEILVRKSAGVLEAEYEDTEDPLIESLFATANYSLARLRLAQQDVSGAIDLFQDVLGLLTGDDEFVVKLRARAHVGYGLASFMRKEPYSAIKSFEVALEHAGDNLLLKSQITILLAQVMWSIGSEEYRDTAKIQLLQCIASDPGNVTAITNLAGMGFLSNDEALVDAALSELLDMPTEQRQQLDPADDVNYLLAQQSFIQGNHRKALMYAQRSLHAIPSNLRTRNRLATVALQQQERRAALAILLGGQSDITQNPLALEERLCLLAVTYALGDSQSEMQLGLRIVQRAIVLFPSSPRPWQTLAFVRSRSA